MIGRCDFNFKEAKKLLLIVKIWAWLLTFIPSLFLNKHIDNLFEKNENYNNVKL